MKRRITSLVLAILLIVGVVPVSAEAQDILVYFSMSYAGEFAESVTGESVTYIPVQLEGQESYTLDDLFAQVHSEHHPDGENAYASSFSEQWGWSVDMLWGDTSYYFGYKVNGGNVNGPKHIIENGDFVDAFIYQNQTAATMEGYAFFDQHMATVKTGEELPLHLVYESGYDELWNIVYSPCEGADIYINGGSSNYTTDENGDVVLTFEEAGTYVVSAKKMKTVNDREMTAITLPLCVVTVESIPEQQLIHNIAAGYAACDFEEAGGNLPWILADMMVYETLYPESEFILTEERKEEGLKEIVSFAKNATRPGDLAKSILAIRALGFDASRVYTDEFEMIDLVENLTALIEAGDESVTDIYTLPYVLIALSQAEGYATQEQIDALLLAAIESKEFWLDTEWGTDGLTPMILALAPYCDVNDAVADAVSEALTILRNNQREDGLIDAFPDYESASTGLALCAFSAMGIDVRDVICGGNSLIDGMLSVANEELTAFPNAFATEQGFRGFLAWQLLAQGTGRRIYDFSDKAMEEANVAGTVLCPVVFKTTPKRAVIAIEGVDAISGNVFDLDAGTYTYTATASGYRDTEGEIVITEEDVAARTAKNITVTLTPTGGGGPGVVEKEEEPEEIKPEEKPHETTPVETVFDDVAKTDWYYNAVQYAYNQNLFTGTDKGFEPNQSMTRAMLVTVLYRLDAPESKTVQTTFADVVAGSWYAESVAWAAENQIVTGVSKTEFAPDANITREQLAVILYRYAKEKGYDIAKSADLTFEDASSVSGYAKEAMGYAVGVGLLGGRDGNKLCPDDKATRAEVATILMRFAEVIGQ